MVESQNSFQLLSILHPCFNGHWIGSSSSFGRATVPKAWGCCTLLVTLDLGREKTVIPHKPRGAGNRHLQRNAGLHRQLSPFGKFVGAFLGKSNIRGSFRNAEIMFRLSSAVWEAYGG